MLDFPYQTSTGIPYVILAIELVKWIAWPVVVVYVSYLFRDQLFALFGRLTGLSIGGAEIQFGDQKSAKSIEKSVNQPLRELRGVERTEAISIVETNLHKAFESVDESEKYERAIRELAQARLDAALAITHGMIFGSQIALLRKIREAGFITRADAEKYFEGLQNDNDFHKEYTLNDYLQYLFIKELIVEDENGIRLTPFGHEYFLFLYRSNVPTDRPF